jgi:hypothetical protein
LRTVILYGLEKNNSLPSSYVNRIPEKAVSAPPGQIAQGPDMSVFEMQSIRTGMEKGFQKKGGPLYPHRGKWAKSKLDRRHYGIYPYAMKSVMQACSTKRVPSVSSAISRTPCWATITTSKASSSSFTVTVTLS